MAGRNGSRCHHPMILRHSLWPSKRLSSPICQTSPEPLKRTEQEVLKPNRTDDQLQYPNAEDNKVNLIILQIAEIVQTITEEEERADHRMHDVIGKRHLSHGDQGAK